MKINRTDEQWKALLIKRAETLHKLTTLIAPYKLTTLSAVMEGALWSVYDAIHKGSTRSKIRSMRHLLWVTFKIDLLFFWRLKIRRMDPDKDETWM